MGILTIKGSYNFKGSLVLPANSISTESYKEYVEVKHNIDFSGDDISRSSHHLIGMISLLNRSKTHAQSFLLADRPEFAELNFEPSTITIDFDVRMSFKIVDFLSFYKFVQYVALLNKLALTNEPQLPIQEIRSLDLVGKPLMAKGSYGFSGGSEESGYSEKISVDRSIDLKPDEINLFSIADLKFLTNRSYKHVENWQNLKFKKGEVKVDFATGTRIFDIHDRDSLKYFADACNKQMRPFQKPLDEASQTKLSLNAENPAMLTTYKLVSDKVVRTQAAVEQDAPTCVDRLWNFLGLTA